MKDDPLISATKDDLIVQLFECQEQLEESLQIINVLTRKMAFMEKENARFKFEAKRAREQLVGARARFKRKLKRVKLE